MGLVVVQRSCGCHLFDLKHNRKDNVINLPRSTISYVG